jgi:multiple sugar transport system substrate-binding protein
MKRRLLLNFALVAVLALGTSLALVLATGCGSKKSTPTRTGTNHTPVTLTVWHPWTVATEKKGFQDAVAGFSRQYPWITLKIVPYPNSDEFDTNLIKNINAGTPPDVMISFGPDYVGKYAADNLLVDLKPLMQRDNFSMGQFAAAALSYTSFQDKQVALPVLTDAYGLYYNKDMFAKAGISSPPKTMSELMDDAKKLTVRNADGSIAVAGFVPLLDFNEIGPADLAHAWGGTYFDADGKPHVATDPAWAAALTWQKQLVDWYGYQAITDFYGTYVDKEWTSQQAFETDKVAMCWDGEWRTKMIANDKAKVNYGTAPFPAADDHPEMYGSGRVGGTIAGIPRGTQHADEAWLLVQYLSTNTDFLVSLANGLGNVPTTQGSATSSALQMVPQFQTFIDVWNSPKSGFSPPLTATGSGYADILNSFDEKWVSGKVSDLQAGLAQVDNDIANQLALGTGP